MEPTLMGKALEFLDKPQEVSRVCKDMRLAVSGILQERIQPSGSQFLDPIRKSFEERFGQLSAEDVRGVNRRARNIRNTAVATVRRAAPLLSNVEWNRAEIDPSAPKEKDFDRIHAMIRDRRAENLIGFFEWIGTQEGMEPVKDFMDSLPPVLSLSGKAQAIRTWLAGDAHVELLNRITNLHVEEVFPESRNGQKMSIPSEILRLRNLDIDTLGIILIRTSMEGNLEVVQALMADVIRFSQIADEDVSESLSWAVCHQHPQVVSTLLRSLKIQAPHLGGALKWAVEKGDMEIVRLSMNHPRFSQVSPIVLGDVIVTAARKEHMEIALALVENPRFGEISCGDLETILHQMRREVSVQVICALMDSRGFGALPLRNLNLIFCYAAEYGLSERLRHLIESPRFGEIQVNYLVLALSRAVEEGQVEIVRKIVHCPRSGEIHADRFREAFREAVRRGTPETAKALLESGKIRLKDVQSVESQLWSGRLQIRRAHRKNKKILNLNS
jgi:hypothetical protein